MKFSEVCKRNKHENIIYQVLQVTILKWSIRKFPNHVQPRQELFQCERCLLRIWQAKCITKTCRLWNDTRKCYQFIMWCRPTSPCPHTLQQSWRH